jgi:fucose permease
MKNDPLKLFVLSCLTFGVGGLSGGALGVVWIHIQGDFGLPLSALGVLVTVSTVGRLLTSFVSGSLIGRFGIAWVLVAGLSMIMVGILGFAVMPGWELMVLAGFINGLGGGVLVTGINAFAAVNFSSSRMNWIHAAFGVGATLGPIFVTHVVIDLNLDWRWNYLFFAGTYLVLIVLYVFTRQEWRLAPERDQPDEPSSAAMSDTLQLPIVRLLAVIFLVATGLELTTGQLTNNLLVESRSIDLKVAGTWVSMYYASLTVSRILVGFVIKHIRSGLFLRMNMLGTMLGAGLLWSNLSPMTSFLGLAIIGFTVAPFAPLMTSATPGRVGTAHTANTIGFQFTGGAIGIAFFPWLAGVLAEAVGLEIIPMFLFIIAALTFLLHEMILRRDAHPTNTPALASTGFSSKD